MVMRKLLNPRATLAAAALLAASFMPSTASARLPVKVDADQEWRAPVQGQVLGIATDREAYAPGEPITLKIYLKNVSVHEIHFVRWSALDMFRTSVFLPDGKPAPLSLYGKERFSRNHSSGWSFSLLKPGEVVSFNVELSRLFDFSLEGRYMVSVAGGAVKVKGKEVASTDATSLRFTLEKVESNRLEITIDEGDLPSAKPGIRARRIDIENVRATLSIPKACKLGQPAPLTIKIWNADNSDHPQRIYCNDKAGLPNGRTKLELFDRDTNTVLPLRESAKHKLDRPDPGDFPGGPTELGGEASWTVDLNDWFALKPGRYKLKTTLSLPRKWPAPKANDYLEIIVDDLKFAVETNDGELIKDVTHVGPSETTASAQNEGAVVEITALAKYTARQPIPITVVIRNTGDKPFYCLSVADLPNDKMEMKLENRDTKTPVKMSKRGKIYMENVKDSGQAGIERLEKGKWMSRTIDIAEFFPITAGRYTFTASFVLHRDFDSHDIPVVVNGLDFTVAK
jgi:hypothetical protein